MRCETNGNDIDLCDCPFRFASHSLVSQTDDLKALSLNGLDILCILKYTSVLDCIWILNVKFNIGSNKLNIVFLDIHFYFIEYD